MIMTFAELYAAWAVVKPALLIDDAVMHVPVREFKRLAGIAYDTGYNEMQGELSGLDALRNVFGMVD